MEAACSTRVRNGCVASGRDVGSAHERAPCRFFPACRDADLPPSRSGSMAGPARWLAACRRSRRFRDRRASDSRTGKAGAPHQPAGVARDDQTMGGRAGWCDRHEHRAGAAPPVGGAALVRRPADRSAARHGNRECHAGQLFRRRRPCGRGERHRPRQGADRRRRRSARYRWRIDAAGIRSGARGRRNRPRRSGHRGIGRPWRGALHRHQQGGGDGACAGGRRHHRQRRARAHRRAARPRGRRRRAVPPWC